MNSSKREVLHITNNITGAVSVLPCGYFWSSSVAFQLFHVRYNPAQALIGIVAAVPLSAVAGMFGCRAWYLVKAASAGTFLFFMLTHLVD